MSLVDPAPIACPKCGTALRVERTASVNAVRRPDLGEAIKDGSFQAVECSQCMQEDTQIRYSNHVDRDFAALLLVYR